MELDVAVNKCVESTSDYVLNGSILGYKKCSEIEETKQNTEESTLIDILFKKLLK